MHASRGVVVIKSSCSGCTECLSEHVDTTCIRQKNHTTHLYKTPIQQDNR